eukprot:GHRR01031743.1.p1 GENE.GHRR01031743.1~~GHRR01031743.1.p1  ORF type:complete len:181 (-),score=30.66 GHRR01031743.1:220-762(-)
MHNPVLHVTGSDRCPATSWELPVWAGWLRPDRQHAAGCYLPSRPCRTASPAVATYLQLPLTSAGVPGKSQNGFEATAEIITQCVVASSALPLFAIICCCVEHTDCALTWAQAGLSNGCSADCVNCLAGVRCHYCFQSSAALFSTYCDRSWISSSVKRGPNVHLPFGAHSRPKPGILFLPS